MTNPPNVVDYLTLGAAIVSPLVAAATTIWSIRRGEREKFDLHIEWEMFEPGQGFDEAPILHVHNRSASKILLSEIRFLTGAFFRRRRFGTAIYWEDPLDLGFPYAVESQAIRRFMLSEVETKRLYARLGRKSKLWGMIRRSAIWVQVRTVAGVSKAIGAEAALPWDNRPSWAKIEDDDNG